MKIKNLFLIACLLASSALFAQLSPIAPDQSKFIGCAWSNGQNLNFQQYWNQVTPENGGKWGSVEGTRGVMNWSSLDAAYNLAKKHGMSFKQHTLIWGAQQPSWIGQLDTASQRKEIEQWFSLQAARYPDMEYIDVVNEPLHNAPNGMLPWGSTTKNVDYAKALGGAGVTGWDWLIKSFRMARKYFPNSKLILNEYGVINSTTETQKYIKIIKLLQVDNLIDGIGEQAHAFSTYGTSAATLTANLDALAATGLPIYITEMDIDGLTDQAQLTEMRRVFSVFWTHPAVKGITFWGFRNGLWRNDQGAYLITQAGVERPALKWLKAYVNDTLVATQSVTVSTFDGSTSIDKLGTKITMVASVLPLNATINNVTWMATPAGLATIDSKGVLTAVAYGTVSVTASAWDGSGKRGTMDLIIENTTGLFEYQGADHIRVFPNPVINGSFTIQGMDAIQHIELVDLMGRKVTSFNHLNQSTLDIQVKVPKGIYVLNLHDGQQVFYKKIRIQ